MSAVTLVYATGGVLALGRRPFAARLLPRVLGIYIAVCAGAIQILDIAVDRLALDERVFAFALVLAVLGLPFSGVAAVMIEAARAERRPPHAPASRLTRRLELMLSCLRVADLNAEAGDEEEATRQRERCRTELQVLLTELGGLLRKLEQDEGQRP